MMSIYISTIGIVCVLLQPVSYRQFVLTSCHRNN